MHWDDEGILLTLRKFSEHDAIVAAFTRTHGIARALVKGASGKRHRGACQPGNLVHLRVSARLPEHLGTAALELISPLAVGMMRDPLALEAWNSAAALLTACLAEHDSHAALYGKVKALAEALASTGRLPSPMGAGGLAEGDRFAAYARFERDLLTEAGFGLDLSRCAASGSAEDLIYVSPKSGRAVSREAGAPYREKLLPLPGFLLESEAPDAKNEDREGTRVEPCAILDALRLTGYFLAHRAFVAKGGRLPEARGRFLSRLERAIDARCGGVSVIV